MIPRHPYPFERRRRCQDAQRVDENPAFRVTAEELARMHPLLRAVIGAITCDAVETTTVYDREGSIVSVRSKRKKQHYSAQAIHSLLTAVRPLLEMEQKLAARGTRHDLDGQAGHSPDHDPS